jgi:hypothetical protein
MVQAAILFPPTTSHGASRHLFPPTTSHGASRHLVSSCASYGVSRHLVSSNDFSWCKPPSCFLLRLLMVQAAILFPPAPPFGASRNLVSSCASLWRTRYLVSSCDSLWYKPPSCFLLRLLWCKPTSYFLLRLLIVQAAPSCFLLRLFMVHAAILFPPAPSYAASRHLVFLLRLLMVRAAILFPLSPSMVQAAILLFLFVLPFQHALHTGLQGWPIACLSARTPLLFGTLLIGANMIAEIDSFVSSHDAELLPFLNKTPSHAKRTSSQFSTFFKSVFVKKSSWPLLLNTCIFTNLNIPF